jgi:hypothetical protein
MGRCAILLEKGRKWVICRHHRWQDEITQHIQIHASTYSVNGRTKERRKERKEGNKVMKGRKEKKEIMEERREKEGRKG